MSNNIETNVVKSENYFTIGDQNYTIIPSESESKMDSLIQELPEFLKNNRGIDLSEEEKDGLYVKAQDYIRELKRELRGVKFKFFLTRRQYNFLTTLILQKMEYNVDTIFYALELKDFMLSLRDLGFKDDVELKSCDLDATQLTLLYHLISTHKVKGITNEAWDFSNVLRRIGEISKLINYYNGSAENLQKDINEWVYNMGAPESKENLAEEVSQ